MWKAWEYIFGYTDGEMPMTRGIRVEHEAVGRFFRKILTKKQYQALLARNQALIAQRQMREAVMETLDNL